MVAYMMIAIANEKTPNDCHALYQGNDNAFAFVTRYDGGGTQSLSLR